MMFVLLKKMKYFSIFIRSIETDYSEFDNKIGCLKEHKIQLNKQM